MDREVFAARRERGLAFKYRSWLSRIEIERSVLRQQCFDQRLSYYAKAQRGVTAWERERNALDTTGRQQLGMAEARSKLTRLYPAQSLRSKISYQDGRLHA